MYCEYHDKKTFEMKKLKKILILLEFMLIRKLRELLMLQKG